MDLIKREFTWANIMELTVGTNVPQGGDSGHGGRTVFELEDMSSTDWNINTTVNQFGMKKLSIEFGGDSEAYLLIDVLKYATKTLENQIKENKRKKEN